MPRIRIDEDLLAGDDGEQEEKERGELTFMDDEDATDDDALKLDFSDDEEEGEQGDDEDAGEGDPDEYAEEEEEEAVAAKKGEEEDDLSDYSKSVRKRIERERRLKEEARAQLAAVQAELEERRRADRAAKIDGEYDAAVEELEDARSDADVRKEAEALAKLTRLATEKENLAAGKDSKPENAGPSPAYAAWLKRNAWFVKPEHEVQHAATMAVAKKLVAEGLNDETPEFYERLDKELPKHIKVPREAKPPAPRTTIERRPERGPSGKRRVVVTPQLKREMRAFGLDPKNPTHMKAYLNGDSNA